MSDEKKLDFSAISFDNVVGDNAAGLETIPEPQEVEVKEETPVSDELDNDVEDIREEESIGDEDYEDGVDEDVEDEHFLLGCPSKTFGRSLRILTDFDRFW